MTADKYADPRGSLPTTGEYDVLVVGAGPVGLTTATLLGLCGWQVGVVERWPQPYPLPRAVVFHHDAARILAGAGLAEVLPTLSEPAADYEWRNGKGETLLRLASEDTSYSGWPAVSMFTQPRLEVALEQRARTIPHIDILRGWEAVDVAQDAQAVRLTVAESTGPEPAFRHDVRKYRTLRAPYVVGCDGANSFVRSRMGTPVTDLGFHHDWLVLDVVPDDQDRVWSPLNLQVCDPVRPTTVVSGGPGRRRWEFMRLPGETLADLNREERAWELLRPYAIDPDNATLERHTVYTFQACWADTWRQGRLLIAGDAAHQMPPFAGQGMCSGIRDAANLAWKLDLVLAGQAQEALLDTYTTERRQHLQQAIGQSLYLGGIICQSDPAAAAERDKSMIAEQRNGGDQTAALFGPQSLTEGLLMHDAAGQPTAPAGELGRQGKVRFQGGTGLFDQTVGPGFTLLATRDPHDLLDEDCLAWCKRVGIRLLRVTRDPSADGPADVVDLDGVYSTYLAETGQIALLIRPDSYIFGGAAHPGEIPRLIITLRNGLTGETAALESTSAESSAAELQRKRAS
jgi:flavoprotein hydroxylase